MKKLVITTIALTAIRVAVRAKVKNQISADKIKITNLDVNHLVTSTHL